VNIRFGIDPLQDDFGRSMHWVQGQRFTPLIHTYVAKWLREKLWERLSTFHSEQYRKAWFASFPPELWPAEEEESEEGRIFLKLKNGTRLLAYEPDGTHRTSLQQCSLGEETDGYQQESKRRD